MISKLRLIAFACLSIGITSNFAAVQTPVHPPHISSDEEAFLIRRIAEFWKDGDYGIVKTQILDFFDKYPNTHLKDYFSGILGDIYLQENSYGKALASYEIIKDPEITEKIILNKLQCYYELDQFGQLIAEGRPLVEKEVETLKNRQNELYLLLAEGCFRQALQEENPDVKVSLSYEAKRYYDKLEGTSYAQASTFALAEIYAILGEKEKGAQMYLSLSKLHPEMEEDLLFQAAILQAQFDKEASIATFSKVKDLKGKKASDAAFNQMVLLFQNGNYKELLSSYQGLPPQSSPAHQATVDFIIGKSFFSTGDYENAIPALGHYIDSQYIPNEELKNALLIQMTCAHQVSDEQLFSKTFEKLDTLFPEDSEIPKALFMHAMILKEQGATQEAEEKLREIKEKYQNFEDRESFLFEYGLLSHQNKRWKESYETFKEYTSLFPDSIRIEAAWKLFLSSSLNFYKQAEESHLYSKQSFFEDLGLVLNSHQFLKLEEMKDYSLLYAKTAYELESYGKALQILQDHVFTKIEEENDPLALAEAHFIAGLCHAEMQGDHSAFCMHLEQAILLNPELYDTPTTHLQLYNAYISLAGFGEGGEIQVDSSQQQAFISQAAEHLQEAIDKGQSDIKSENRLWLANHHFQKIKDYIESHWTHKISDKKDLSLSMNRAIEHYQSLLYKHGHPTEISSETLHLETEFLKLAKLMEYDNQYKEKLALVKNLIEQQSKKPELNWTTKKQALFELATVYQKLGDRTRALETFSFIHSSSDTFPLSLANTAVLESARLHFELLDHHYKTETNEEVISILNDLKELQIRKNVSSEPTHLEAALEYATIRSQIGNPLEKDSRLLFFLKRIQDDFTSQEDLVTQDYLLHLKQNEPKKRLFDSYMKFIEAEKFRLEAKKMYQEEQLSEVEELHESALALYNELKTDSGTSKNLYKRIVSSIQEINALNAY
jgi:tetratricopeptide (TPR) repeat protein